MGHLIQKHQGVRSTKPKPPPPSSSKEPMLQVQYNEVFLQVTPIIKLYTDYEFRFSVHYRSGHQYVIIAYHCDANLLLLVPFKTRKDSPRLQEYNKIMQRLSNHKLIVDLKIIDNEASVEYKRAIKNKLLIHN